jgi:predicted nucleic acid-binding protein
MLELVICDTSCLILFDKIKQLELLRRCYSDIYVTPEIAEEFSQDLPDWITIRKATNQALQQTLNQILDKGEASAIALTYDLSNTLLVLDDLKARRVAKSLNLKITGSLGILVKAKEQGHIEKLSPILKQVQQTDFRISEKIFSKILAIVGE